MFPVGILAWTAELPSGTMFSGEEGIGLIPNARVSLWLPHCLTSNIGKP